MKKHVKWAVLVGAAGIALVMLAAYATDPGMDIEWLIVRTWSQLMGNVTVGTDTSEAALTMKNGGITIEKPNMITFEDLGAVGFAEGGFLGFGQPFFGEGEGEEEGALVAGTDNFFGEEEPPFVTDYFLGLMSTGVTMLIGGDMANVVGAGAFYPANAEPPGAPSEGINGVFMSASSNTTNEGASMRCTVHPWSTDEGGTLGAMDLWDPNTSTIRSSVRTTYDDEGNAMALMKVRGADDTEAAKVALSEEDGDGQVKLQNAAGSSITIEPDGDIVLQLGS